MTFALGFFILAALITLSGFVYLIFAFFRADYRAQHGRPGGASAAKFLGERLLSEKRRTTLSIPAELKSRLLDGFACRRCGGQAARVSAFCTLMDDPLSAWLSLDAVPFITVTCTACGLADIFSWDAILSPKTWRDIPVDEGPVPCRGCRGTRFIAHGVGVRGAGDYNSLTELPDGKYKARTCLGCGLSLFRRIERPAAFCRRPLIVDAIGRLHREFSCPMCKGSTGQAALAVFMAASLGGAFEVPADELVLLDCEDCVHTEIFDPLFLKP